jgi:hypothetical protein
VNYRGDTNQFFVVINLEKDTIVPDAIPPETCERTMQRLRVIASARVLTKEVEAAIQAPLQRDVRIFEEFGGRSSQFDCVHVNISAAIWQTEWFGPSRALEDPA